MIFQVGDEGFSGEKKPLIFLGIKPAEFRFIGNKTWAFLYFGEEKKKR